MSSRPLLLLLLILVFAPALVSASALLEPPRQEDGSLLTDVASFSLQGRRHLHRLPSADLGILILPNGERRLPMVAMLEGMAQPYTLEDGTLRYHLPGQLPVVLATATGHVSIGQDVQRVSVIPGVSDLTGTLDVFVTEDTARTLLGLKKLEWREELYHYDARTEVELAAFQAMTQPAEERNKHYEEIGVTLPEVLGPASPGFDLAELDFLRASVRGSLVLNQSEETGVQVAPSGRVSSSLWGRLMGGTYQLGATQAGRRSGGQFSVSKASWSAQTENVELGLGDRGFGLSNLVFPNVQMTGVTVNGLTGAGLVREDRSSLGARPSFLPSAVLQGEAPLDATVELLINGRSVATTDVEEYRLARPGYGLYRFEGINLSSGRANNVTYIIRNSDGTTDEIRETIGGSINLLGRGQSAFVAGLGSRRVVSDATLGTFFGQFAGARALHGLTHDITIGGSVAYQDRFASTAFAEGEPDSLTLGDFRFAPRNSTHLGGGLTWRMAPPLLFDIELASTNIDGVDRPAFAWNAAGELQLDRWLVGTYAFRYAPEFFNGVNQRLYDRAGLAGHAAWRSQRGDRVSVTAGRVRDDTSHQIGTTTFADFQSLEFSSSKVIPNTSLQLSFAQMLGQDQPVQRLVGIDARSNLSRSWALDAQLLLGDNLREGPRDELLEGIGIPGLSFLNGPSTRFDLSTRLGSRDQLRLSHFSSGTLERTSARHFRNSSGGSRLQLSNELGYEWSSSSPYLQSRLDYFLDRNRTGRLGIDLRRSSGRTVASLVFSHQGLFGLFDSPKLMKDSRTNPERGGVRGKVFLDADGDGHLDPGERGVEGFVIQAEEGERVFSEEDGSFYLMRRSDRRKMRVSLDGASIPTAYVATHGTQEAHIRNGMLTEVNLGLALTAAVTGTLTSVENDGSEKPISGVRILIVNDNGVVLGESITASDGSYYIGDIKPGTYDVVIDTTTLSDLYEAGTVERSVDVVATEEFTEIEGIDLQVILRSGTEPSSR